MASFNKFQKLLMLAFDWILYSAGAADTCQVTVTQPRFQEAEYSTHTVLLTCSFSASGCSLSKLQVLWFRFFTNKHEDLCTPRCTNDQKFKVLISSENSISLQINDLTVNDSAVYFCGIAFSDSSSPHSKRTGDGTVLTKRGPEMQSTEEFNCMIIISTLLLLYCITVFTLLIVYKMKIVFSKKKKQPKLQLESLNNDDSDMRKRTSQSYVLKPKLLRKSGNEDQGPENCKISSGRKIFQAIAQELQKQRYAEHCQEPDHLEDDTVYQNR